MQWTKREDITNAMMGAKTSFEHCWLIDELNAWDDEHLDNNIDEQPTDNIDFHGEFDEMSKEAQDAIINPKHYKIFPAGEYPDGIEYTDLCEKLLEDTKLNHFQAHIFGQIIKYIVRLGKKDSLSQDAKKISWYADYLEKHIEKQRDI